MQAADTKIVDFVTWSQGANIISFEADKWLVLHSAATDCHNNIKLIKPPAFTVWWPTGLMWEIQKLVCLLNTVGRYC